MIRYTIRYDRSKSHHVDLNWLWSKGCKIYREQEEDEKGDLKKHETANFIKRHNLKHRINKCNKRVPKAHYWSEMEKFELKLLALIMTKNGEDLSPFFVSMLTNHHFIFHRCNKDLGGCKKQISNWKPK